MGVIVFLVQDLFENIISVIIDIIDTSKPIKDIKNYQLQLKQYCAKLYNGKF